MLRKYWLESRRSLEGRLLLGSLMGDLAVTVDASYVRGDDERRKAPIPRPRLEPRKN